MGLGRFFEFYFACVVPTSIFALTLLSVLFESIAVDEDKTQKRKPTYNMYP